ncbi:MAG TPA: ABC transporter permease [Candidatus Paceibacterota bacterium]|nr:ABC transporter permease [Candidatus Paceibacterota bacterium]
MKDTLLSIPKEENIKPHSSFYWGASDSFVLIRRSLRHIFRNKDQFLSLAIQPIMFMLLFRYVFGGAIDTGGTSYVNFLVAGILIQMSAFGATTTSLSVASDLKTGLVDRLKSLPIVSGAVMTGHVVADLVRNIISSAILIVVALLIGFRPVASFTDWLLIVLLLVLFTLAFSWISAVMGLMAKTVEGVQWFGFILVFPLTFASAAFVPTETMPGILRLFAENQPVTHVIEAMRALMNGLPTGNHVWITILWCVGLVAIFMPLASYLFRRKGTR